MRTLLIVVMLLSLPLGWIGTVLHRTRQQKPVVKSLEGDHVDARWRFGYVIHIGIYNYAENPNIPWVARNLRGFPKLRSLYAQGPHVTDADLVHIKELDSLQHLVLKETAITDTGLQLLTEMDNLEYLAIDGAGVSWEGMDKLKKSLPNCEVSSWPRFQSPHTPLRIGL